MDKLYQVQTNKIDAAETMPGKPWDSAALRRYAQAMKQNPDQIQERHITKLFLLSLTHGDYRDLCCMRTSLLTAITPEGKRIALAGQCLRALRSYDRSGAFLSNDTDKTAWNQEQLSGFLKRCRSRTAWAIRQQMRKRADTVTRKNERTAQPS